MKGLLKLLSLALMAGWYYSKYHLYHFVKNIIKWRKFNTRTMLPKGHHIYDFDIKNLELVKGVTIGTKRQVTILGIKYSIKDYKIKKGHAVIIALNDKNAIRRAKLNLKLRGYEQPEEAQIKVRRLQEITN